LYAIMDGSSVRRYGALKSLSLRICHGIYFGGLNLLIRGEELRSEEKKNGRKLIPLYSSLPRKEKYVLTK